jgi:hypothetical protein
MWTFVTREGCPYRFGAKSLISAASTHLASQDVKLPFLV